MQSWISCKEIVRSELVGVRVSNYAQLWCWLWPQLWERLWVIISLTLNLTVLLPRWLWAVITLTPSPPRIYEIFFSVPLNFYHQAPIVSQQLTPMAKATHSAKAWILISNYIAFSKACQQQKLQLQKWLQIDQHPCPPHNGALVPLRNSIVDDSEYIILITAKYCVRVRIHNHCS